MEIARRHALQKHTLRVLVGAQLLSGAGLAAGIVAGALLAEEMIGSTSGAGLPSALFTLGAAASAFLIGQVSQTRGRRVGLAGGYFFGALGGAGIVVAAAIDSVPLLLGALLIYGAGTASSFQARYAGADLASADARAKAVSVVLVATTAGAVAGPLLTQVTGDFAESVGVIALAGPFMLAALAYLLAALVLWGFLRPDPLLTARSIEDGGSQAVGDDPAEIDVGGVRVAVSVMVLTQFVMVAVMTMTPIHMRDHHHSLTATGAVIAMHVAAMFLPSPVTGVLVDRYGRQRMIAASAITLVSAAALAAVAPPESMALLSIALVLLGLGWNFGVVSGTALLTDSTPLRERASVQGRADLLVQLSGAAGGLGSGFVMAATGYSTLALIGGALSLLMVPLMFAVRPASTRLAT
jgi:MFS family permease